VRELLLHEMRDLTYITINSSELSSNLFIFSRNNFLFLNYLNFCGPWSILGINFWDYPRQYLKYQRFFSFAKEANVGILNLDAGNPKYSYQVSIFC
jgi:hypothetical protein